MNGKKTVFVVQDSSSKNFLPAEKFGELRIILDRGYTRNTPADVFEAIDVELEKMEPDDYLLLSGDTMAIGIAVYIALTNFAQRSPLKILRWVKREYKYKEEEIIV